MALGFVDAFLLLFLVHVSVSLGFMCIEREREALLSLKQGFVDESGRLSSWGIGEYQNECCKWKGITCSNQSGHVVKLNLSNDVDTHGTALKGTISPSLGELHHLSHLDLSGNYFYGNHNYIPESIISLTHLRHLNLSSCWLGGKLPNEFGNLFRLQYLDLQDNVLHGEFPTQILNFSRLKYLDLGDNNFHGVIPHQLANLSCLQYLHIGNFYIDGPYLRSNLEWVPYLSSSLTSLEFAHVDLSTNGNNWLQLVSNLSLLKEMWLRDCKLTDTTPLSISNMNISSSLAVIDLSYNSLTSSIFEWLLNYKRSLAVLGLSRNSLRGPIPNVIRNLSSLQVLNLEVNLLHGGIPKSLWDICSLRELHLRHNKLTGQLHDFFPTFPHCTQKSLKILDLSENQITGTMPDLSQLPSLQELYLHNNQINGTLTESIGQLSKLEVLDVRENSVEGMVTEAHFTNLSKLKTLDLSYNTLVLNISAHWVPPFRLGNLYLSSCKIGPSFPLWLRTQTHYKQLDMSGSEISDMAPLWFWKLPCSMEILDLSNNQFGGEIPYFQVDFYENPKINLSSNLFHGPIPSSLSSAKSLLLNNNKFTDSTSLLCTEKANNMCLLDLSNNHLSELPNCWKNFKSLSLLYLNNNNISGKIPTSMAFLFNIQTLHLGYNKLIGEIPPSLSNCKKLVIFDARHNKLSGPVPSWIGDKLQKLKVLVLKSNQFSGTLPMNICLLASLQVLDLSQNNISGSIPTCANKLTSMTGHTYPNETISFEYELFGNGFITFGDYYDASETVTWKGKDSEYKSTLGLMRSIDLSSNKLVGVIPSEIMDLKGLNTLNLSRNMLSGNIPSAVGQLKSLDALDLSRNLLFGRIPSSLSELNFLNTLDLPYNNLSGKIPMGTQIQSLPPSSFMGNPELCGAPLPKSCLDGPINDSQNDGNVGEDNHILDRGFYISMALGFVIAFWGVCGTLILKESRRYAYFKFFSSMYDQLYVLVAVNMAKLRRRFNSFKGSV